MEKLTLREHAKKIQVLGLREEASDSEAGHSTTPIVLPEAAHTLPCVLDGFRDVLPRHPQN